MSRPRLPENNVTYTGIFLIQVKSLLGQKITDKTALSHMHSRDFNDFIGDKQVCHEVLYRYLFGKRFLHLVLNMIFYTKYFSLFRPA